MTTNKSYHNFFKLSFTFFRKFVKKINIFKEYIVYKIKSLRTNNLHKPRDQCTLIFTHFVYKYMKYIYIVNNIGFFNKIKPNIFLDKSFTLKKLF